MDIIDQTIITFLSEDPDLTIKDIAIQVNMTQPAIGDRVRKLRKKGLLQKIYGLNFKVANLQIIRVDIQTKGFNELINQLRSKPNILNIFTLTGTYNLSIYLFGKDLAEINQFIDKNIRNSNYIIKIKVNVVNRIVSHPVLPIIFNNNGKHSLKKTDRDLKNNGRYPLPKFQASILKFLKETHEAHLVRIQSHLQELVDSKQITYNYRVSEQKAKSHLECLEELGLIEYFKLGSTKFVRLKN